LFRTGVEVRGREVMDIVEVRGREVIDIGHDPSLQHLPGVAGGPDRAVQKNEVLGVMRHVLHVVGSAEEGQPSGPLQIADLGVEPGSCGGIEPCRRLVQDEKARIPYHGPCDEHPLLLATGQVLIPSGGEAGHAN
jgi:hypothetical protein